MQRALSRVADSPVECVCAGRTDAGVHALRAGGPFRHRRRAQRARLAPRRQHLSTRRRERRSGCAKCPTHFHARYSAIARSYRYLILNRDSRPALAAGRATWERRPLDAARMHAAAQALVGEHDFSAFRAVECQAKSPVRRVERLEVDARRRVGDASTITANAFLHHMVRNIAGLLMSVGHGESPPERVATVLASRDRKTNAATAPPDGLYLAGVRYPAEFGLPCRRAVPQSAIIGRTSRIGVATDMSWFEKIMPSRIKTERRTRSVPEGLWIKCSACDAVLYRAELERNLHVCPKCSHHMRIGARERLARFLDEGEQIGDRRRRLAGRSAQVSRQQALPRPPRGGAEGDRRDATRWS